MVTVQRSQDPDYLELVRNGVAQKIPKIRLQKAVPKPGESLAEITVNNRPVHLHYGELTTALNGLGQ